MGPIHARWLLIALVAMRASVASAAPPSGAAMTQHDMKQQLAAMAEAASAPTDAHRALAMLVGRFDEITEVRMGPGEPMRAHSVCTAQWVMGGRFVRLESSAAPDEELKGDRLVVYGYDPAAKKYTLWNVESGSLTAVTALGDYDSTSKTLTFVGERDQSGVGKVPMRWVLRAEAGGVIAQTIALKFPGAPDFVQVVSVRRTPLHP